MRSEAGDDPEAWVGRAYELALARSPRASELAASAAFLEEQAARRAETNESTDAGAEERDDPMQTALVDLCQVLMNLNEFIYID